MSRTNSVSPLVPDGNDNGNLEEYRNGVAHHVNPAFELPPLKQSNGTPLTKRRLPDEERDESGQNAGRTVMVSMEPEENEKGRSSLDYRTDLDMEFYRLLGPLIKAMTFFGLWHGYVVDPLHNPPPKTTWKKVFNSKNYCVFVQILLWLNTIRYAPSFFVGSFLAPERTFVKVILQFFTLQCALNASVFFWCVSKKDKFAIFLHHFEVAIQCNPTTAVNAKWMKRGSRICLAVAIIFMTLHFFNQATTALAPLPIFRNNSLLFVAPFEYSIPLQFVMIVVFIFNFAAWIFPLLFYTFICVILSRKFVHMDLRLEKSLRKGRIDGCFPKDFEILRRQHEALATALDTSNDGLFTYVNLVTYVTMAPLACFLLYKIISPNPLPIGITGWIFYWTWMVSIFINVLLVSWIAALVNDRVSLLFTFFIIEKSF